MIVPSAWRTSIVAVVLLSAVAVTAALAAAPVPSGSYRGRLSGVTPNRVSFKVTADGKRVTALQLSTNSRAGCQGPRCRSGLPTPRSPLRARSGAAARKSSASGRSSVRAPR